MGLVEDYWAASHQLAGKEGDFKMYNALASRALKDIDEIKRDQIRIIRELAASIGSNRTALKLNVGKKRVRSLVQKKSPRGNAGIKVDAVPMGVAMRQFVAEMGIGEVARVLEVHPRRVRAICDVQYKRIYVRTIDRIFTMMERPDRAKEFYPEIF